MEDRTPDWVSYYRLKESLDATVKDIYDHVPIITLDRNAMVGVMRYLGRNFGQRTEYGASEPMPGFGVGGEVVFYDIGYHLIRDQISREMKLPKREKSLLLDGVMGFLWYHAGKCHDLTMDHLLRFYADTFGVGRLNRNFRTLRAKFESFRDVAEAAETDVRELSQSPVEEAFIQMFTQFFVYSRLQNVLDLRARNIAEIVHGFEHR